MLNSEAVLFQSLFKFRHFLQLCKEPAVDPGDAEDLVDGRTALQGLKNVNFDDMDQMLPVSIMLIGMPISGSIGHAIGLGLISYTVVKLLSGKAKDVSVLTYVISALFLIKFFAVV